MPPLASCRGGAAFKTRARLTAARLLRFAFRLDSGTEEERLRATVQEAMEKEQRCGVERCPRFFANCQKKRRRLFLPAGPPTHVRGAAR